jgi:hypothetical protein
MFSCTKNSRSNASSFQIVKDSMLQTEDLPLSEVVNDETWQGVFEQYQVDFGNDPDAVYTPALTLWALISQVFFKAENRSCKAAVERVAAWWALTEDRIVSTNTGAYCRARKKIRYEAVRDLVLDIAQKAEAAYHEQAAEEYQGKLHPVVAQVQSEPLTGRLLMVDGFTVTAADTPENQEEYPQNPAQQEGLGFPIIRGVSLISLTTGLLIGLELGPYAGKESGETALLRKMLNQLQSGDTLVADSFYCSYWLLAACQAKGVKVVMKNHDKRDDYPAGARRIDKHQRITVWHKPQCPDWMSESEYAALPDQIEVRLVDVTITQPGFRATKYTVATTILETKMYTRDWITSVYRGRWLVELDIRSVKCSLGMDIVRAKTPAMVRTEIWSCFLAYNLIRFKMMQSCTASGRMPRTLSFTTTMTMLATSWLVGSVILTPSLVQLGMQISGSEQVGNRLDRVEPRANKRRAKILALLTKPRQLAKSELLGAAA